MSCGGVAGLSGGISDKRCRVMIASRFEMAKVPCDDREKSILNTARYTVGNLRAVMLFYGRQMISSST